VGLRSRHLAVEVWLVGDVSSLFPPSLITSSISTQTSFFSKLQSWGYVRASIQRVFLFFHIFPPSWNSDFLLTGGRQIWLRLFWICFSRNLSITCSWTQKNPSIHPRPPHLVNWETPPETSHLLCTTVFHWTKLTLSINPESLSRQPLLKRLLFFDPLPSIERTKTWLVDENHHLDST